MVILTSSVQYDSHITNKFLQECAKLLIMCCEHGEVQHNFFWGRKQNRQNRVQ
jgi:hypothetical protein